MQENNVNMGSSRQGQVVSAKADKTIVVAVTDKVRHPLYSKVIQRTVKYHAHDAANKAELGDKVTIVECRPYSKMKSWKLLDIIAK